jgi:hypothetical protein
MKNSSLIVGFLALVGIAVPAFAGGPLRVFDPTTRQPFFYPAPLDLYTDNDPVFSLSGPVSNAVADARSVEGIAEWTNVATATFVGSVAGDFASIGLPDIKLGNVGLVVGTFNGGGYHVVYDHDGSITFALAGPGVLGFSTPEFAETGTPHLTESYAVLNGATVAPGGTQALAWSGVFTHEFGHGVNLAHTQTNGAIGFFGDDRGPEGCAPIPGGPSFSQIETMYPFVDQRPGGSGPEQATVDLLDDISSLSDVYPAAEWPEGFGTVSGTIFDADGVTQSMGVNVIIRNMADPWGDCSSTLSGAFTQGALGPDGRYHFNGLTPGAQYIVYVDAIVAGGFSTPQRVPLPGPEEFWNGAHESNDPNTDAICEAVAITPMAGSPFTADMVFNFGIFLGDDDFRRVELPFPFEFCGRAWNAVYVGSNGFLTFGVGDTDFSQTVSDFLAGPPRIAPLWNDLDPSQGGSITAEDGPGYWTVHYTNVPEFFGVGANTFSVTLRSNNTFDIVYGGLTVQDGLAGRTEGGGVPDPGETDLSAATQPIGSGEGTVYENFADFDNDLAHLDLGYGFCDPFVFVFDPALPGFCYGSTGFHGPTNGALVTIDPVTGAGTLVGQTGLDRLPGLAINMSREIWGSSGGGASRLVRVSASDAVTQIIAPVRSAANGRELTFADALAFDENDVLYAIDASNKLWTVDTSSGFATEVGYTGVAGPPFLVGMAFDPTTGHLFACTGGVGGADEIYEIDRGTGVATLVGNTGLGDGAIPDITFRDDGLFFGSKSAGGGVFNLISIAVGTGAGMVIGPTGFRVSGLAWSVHETTEANLDIKPGVCPNSFSLKHFRLGRGGRHRTGGALAAAVVGTVDFDVTQIDVSSITLEGVQPTRTKFKDVTRLPGAGAISDDDNDDDDGDDDDDNDNDNDDDNDDDDGDDDDDDDDTGHSLCPCPGDDDSDDDDRDGITDLLAFFRASDLSDVVDPGQPGEERLLTVRGFLLDGRPFEAADCIVFTDGREDDDGDEDVPLPPVAEPVLGEAYPNPFNPVTRISYTLSRSSFVTLSIYDVKGRLVDRLVSTTQAAGRHVAQWDAGRYASGIYFYRLAVGDFAETRKMILLK